MKIRDFRLVGIRCFEDTGDIVLDAKCNIFVGKNNAGKSTALRAILGLQGFPLDHVDIRPGHTQSSFVTVSVDGIVPSDQMLVGRVPNQDTMRIVFLFGGNSPQYNDVPVAMHPVGQPTFPSVRPNHTIIPFLAKRKAVQFNQDISLNQQSQLTGTLSSLYSRIDLLATYGHPEHDRFCKAVLDIIGLEITMRASSGDKEAGFYFDKNTFVTLDRMGDGVSEMVALIVELCTEENRIFVLEEPETNLHPTGLKALLAMIRIASERNQFCIATHSNVVVRELGGEQDGKVFRVFRDGDSHVSPSKVEEVERTPSAHMELLRELGYEFTDFDLYSAWLFLEESSAERIIRDILIPTFVPDLLGKLRTYAAGGVTNLGPSISEFLRLVVFIHLQPVYKNRLWVRADGDKPGAEAVRKIREAFPYLEDSVVGTFGREQFELYYPDIFQTKVAEVLAIEDRQTKRKRKAELLQEVIEWTDANRDESVAAWELSAMEQIELLRSISDTLALTPHP